MLKELVPGLLVCIWKEARVNNNSPHFFAIKHEKIHLLSSMQNRKGLSSTSACAPAHADRRMFCLSVRSDFLKMIFKYLISFCNIRGLYPELTSSTLLFRGVARLFGAICLNL